MNLAPGATAAATGTILYPATFAKFVATPADQSARSLVGYAPVAGLPQGASYYVNLAETREEFGKGSMVVTNTAAGVNVRVTRPNGTSIDIVSANGTATLTETPQIAGAATAFDATYTNTVEYAYRAPGWNAGSGHDTSPTYNNTDNDKTTGMHIRHHPLVANVAAEMNALGDFTLVAVGKMSPSRNTQFLHIGSSIAGDGLLISTTENDNEVLIAKNTNNAVDAANGVKASVPNTATARHAYIINKKGTAFEIWVDGVKRGRFDAGDGFALGSASSCGVQIGSDFGGAIKTANIYKRVPNAPETETGVINVVRLFDYSIADAQAEAVFNAYPYIPQGGLYTRTVTANCTFSQTDAWTKEGATGTSAVPEGATVNEIHHNPSATLTVNAAAEIAVNANVAIETLTVCGTAPVTYASDGTHTLTVVGSAVVNSPMRIAYGALNLAGTPVQLGSSGTICFDLSAMDLSKVYVGERLQLTGLIDRNDEKITAIMPTDGSYELAYNTTHSCYELVVKGIKIELEQRTGGANVKLETTSELLTSLANSGLSTTATTSEVNTFLNATDQNGLRHWENLVTGMAANQLPLGMVSAETTSGKALTISVKMVSDTNETAKVNLGYTILRELRKGDGTHVAGPSPDGTAFDIRLLNGEGNSLNAAGLYRVVTLLVCGSVTNEIPSTNAIGIVEVASTASNTITAVPWKRLASAPGEAASDLTVSNFVAFANLSAGDAVYMLDGRAYKMWKNNGGTWEAATTVNSPGTTISIVQNPGPPDTVTIPCGGAVWVQRTDATKPYFLVGQYDESAFRVTVPGSGAALIANPFPTNVTLNAINWGTSVTNDIIRIPRNGLNVELSYDSASGMWGYYTVITDGTFITGAAFVPHEASIPAGTGFIYVRKGGEGFTFEWK